MPRRIHQTESRDRRPKAVVAKGTPLSVRMMRGRPYSWNRREHGLAADMFGGTETLASEQVAAEAVDDGEGVAVEAVAGLEVTLEVGGPDVVGGEHGSQGPTGM